MTYPGPPQEPDPSQGGGPPRGGYPPPPQGPPAYPPPPVYAPAAYPPAEYPPPAYPPPAYPPPAYPQGPPPPGYPAAPPPGYATVPGYPVPPGAYPPPKRRRRWPWIVTGVVVVIIAVLIVVGVVFGRTGSGDPHTAVDKFWSALVQHDRSKAEKYVCSGKNLTKSADFVQLVDELTSYSIGAETGTGNTRVYPVAVHLTSGDGTIDTTVKKSASKWYVCGIAVH